MSLSLRVFLLLMALVFLVIIVRTINKKKLRIQYSFPWMLIAAAMLLLAIFPQIAVFLCSVTGIQTPSNLIYLMGIVILLLISFYQSHPYFAAGQPDRPPDPDFIHREKGE